MVMSAAAIAALPIVCLAAASIVSFPGWVGGVLAGISGEKRHVPSWAGKRRRLWAAWAMSAAAGWSLFVLLWSRPHSDLQTYWLIAALALVFFAAQRSAFWLGFFTVGRHADKPRHVDGMYAPTH